MTKAALVEQVADAIGPRVTKRECRLVVDALLNSGRTRSREATASTPAGPVASRCGITRPARAATPRPARLRLVN